MIQNEIVREIVEQYLEGKKYELIELRVSPKNEILVEIDAYDGVDVDFCAELNQYIQQNLDREVEDYELEVGSVSLTAPFKTKMQYEKNLGHDVEVLGKDGKKYRGQLVEVNDDDFKIDAEVMEAVEGKKRKQKIIKTLTFCYDDVKYTVYDLKI
ncbi:MAG: ribosome assembly cofactor RimP [Paludibacteraceae bacterium]|nr:ribosome assembly cofactor RimP [Paludibacteraceae bacterium]